MRKKPVDQQIPFLRDLLERNVKAIVEREDDVQIECDVAPVHVVFTIRVHHTDMGLVLGERGETANAIRRIVWTACKKTDRRVDIDFV